MACKLVVTVLTTGGGAVFRVLTTDTFYTRIILQFLAFYFAHYYTPPRTKSFKKLNNLN